MSAKLSALRLSDSSVKPTMSENIIDNLARLLATKTLLSDFTMGCHICGVTKRVSLLITETIVLSRSLDC